MPPPPVQDAPPSLVNGGELADGHVQAAAGVVGNEVRVFFPNGKVTFYRSDGRFEAVCRQHQQTSKAICRLTRTSAENARKAAQGRPLGLLVAWLELARHHGCGREHKDPVFVNAGITLAQRQAARRSLEATDGGVALLACERPQREGEPAEPVGVP